MRIRHKVPKEASESEMNEKANMRGKASRISGLTRES